MLSNILYIWIMEEKIKRIVCSVGSRLERTVSTAWSLEACVSKKKSIIYIYCKFQYDATCFSRNLSSAALACGLRTEEMQSWYCLFIYCECTNKKFRHLTFFSFLRQSLVVNFEWIQENVLELLIYCIALFSTPLWN